MKFVAVLTVDDSRAVLLVDHILVCGSQSVAPRRVTGDGFLGRHRAPVGNWYTNR